MAKKNNPARQVEREQPKPLVRRFWRTARGFWSSEKSWKVAWLMTVCLVALVLGQLIFQYQLNLWNKAIFDALEKKDSATVLHQAMIFVPLAAGQHRGRGLRGVRAHAHPAALARLAHRAHDDALARQGPLLPAQSDRGRTQEPRSAHRRRHPHRDRAAGRFRGRHPERGAHLGDVHGRAVVGRRQPDRAVRRRRHSPFPAIWSSRC